MFNRLAHYVHHLMFIDHFQEFPSLQQHLNSLLLQKVIDTCQDSQPCQEDLDCHLSEYAAVLSEDHTHVNYS